MGEVAQLFTLSFVVADARTYGRVHEYGMVASRGMKTAGFVVLSGTHIKKFEVARHRLDFPCLRYGGRQ